MSTFRKYTQDDSFLNIRSVRSIIPTVHEYHIALAFARDYDERGIRTNGNFIPYWNLERVTPAALERFKNEINPDVNVSVYVSIGDRNRQFPFDPIDKDSWITNATISLTKIISDHFDELKNIIGIGIDVYYEQSNESEDFVFCVGEPIKNLKEAEVIKVASIASSYPLPGVYSTLFNNYRNSIDWVVYQFHNEVYPIPIPAILVDRLETIRTKYYKTKNLLLGYSSKLEDWEKISPIVFFVSGTVYVLTRLIAGASSWDISDSVDFGWALLPSGVALHRGALD